jgi:hypothetical protein
VAGAYFEGPKVGAVFRDSLLEFEFGKDFDVQATRGRPNVGELGRH